MTYSMIFQGDGPGHPRQVPGAARGEVRQAGRQEEREVPRQPADGKNLQQQAAEEGGGQEAGLLHSAPTRGVVTVVTITEESNISILVLTCVASDILHLPMIKLFRRYVKIVQCMYYSISIIVYLHFALQIQTLCKEPLLRSPQRPLKKPP